MPSHYLNENTRLKMLLDEYAKSISLEISKEQLTEHEVKGLFRSILDKYVKGEISADDLSMFCEMVYGKLDPGSDLFSLLLMGAEIEWHLRHEPKMAADTISDLLETFTKPLSKRSVSLKMSRIEELLEKYYLWAEVAHSQEKLTLEEGEKIGLCVVDDYTNGKISVDELSLLCDQVYYKLNENLELYNLLLQGGKISWDIRANPMKAASTIRKLFKYFGIEISSAENSY